MGRDFYKAICTEQTGIREHKAHMPYAVVRYIPATGEITYVASHHVFERIAKQVATKRNAKEARRVGPLTDKWQG